MVSEIFSVDGADEEWDLLREPDLAATSPELWRSPGGDYSVRHLEDWDKQPSLALFFHCAGAEPEAVGFYCHGMCWVDPRHRGRGLGVELVLAAAAVAGGSPTRNPAGMGFTAAGVAVHLKAHRRSVGDALARGLPVGPEVLGSLADDPPPMAGIGRPG